MDARDMKEIEFPLEASTSFSVFHKFVLFMKFRWFDLSLR